MTFDKVTGDMSNITLINLNGGLVLLPFVLDSVILALLLLGLFSEVFNQIGNVSCRFFTSTMKSVARGWFSGICFFLVVNTYLI